MPDKIIEKEVEKICSRYKIDPADAEKIIQENFASRPNLVRKISERCLYEDVTRFSEYKKFIKDVRKQIYYHLRQYKNKEQENQVGNQLKHLISESADPVQINSLATKLLSSHISTRERFPFYQAFYHTIFGMIEYPRTIIDIGCGFHPLSYPFACKGKFPENYTAIDRDKGVIDILTTFASCVKPTNLIPVYADLAELKWNDFFYEKEYIFDIAFMLKLIPVIYRQNRKILPELANLPARRILITGSAEAMTRRDNIMRREHRILSEFVRISGRKVIHSFNIENEFGYLLGTS
ncbi:MAG: hypothetical protein GY749_41405 [Desulfobacteraceae bacterium]|nr:hypothetical protein [Desulfobacteraceae bacterium]